VISTRSIEYVPIGSFAFYLHGRTSGEEKFLLLQQVPYQSFPFIEVRVNFRLFKLIRLFMQKVKNANNKIEVSFDWKMLYFIYREICDTCK
jgi:hypothetical protein